MTPHVFVYVDVDRSPTMTEAERAKRAADCEAGRMHREHRMTERCVDCGMPFRTPARVLGA